MHSPEIGDAEPSRSRHDGKHARRANLVSVALFDVAGRGRGVVGHAHNRPSVPSSWTAVLDAQRLGPADDATAVTARATA